MLLIKVVIKSALASDGRGVCRRNLAAGASVKDRRPLNKTSRRMDVIKPKIR